MKNRILFIINISGLTDSDYRRVSKNISRQISRLGFLIGKDTAFL